MELNFNQIKSQFLETLKENDCEPMNENEIILDGQIHRYTIAGHKATSKNGAYCIHIDGRPAGYFQNWKTGEKIKWKFYSKDFRNSNNKTNSADYQAAIEAKRKAAKDKQHQQQRTAISNALKFYKENKVCEVYHHPYLRAKNRNVEDVIEYQPDALKPHEYKNSIIWPLFNVSTGHFQTLQSMYIDADGTPQKRFYKGTPIKNAVYFFNAGGEPEFSLSEEYQSELNRLFNNVIFVAEGIFTAQAVWRALERQANVIACLSCELMFNTVYALKQRSPEAKIIIMADNDRETELKTGRNAGIETAKNVVSRGFAYGYIAPEFFQNETGSDFEDFFTPLQEYLLEYCEEQEKLKSKIANILFSSTPPTPKSKQREQEAIKIEVKNLSYKQDKEEFKNEQ